MDLKQLRLRVFADRVHYPELGQIFQQLHGIVILQSTGKIQVLEHCK